MATAVSGRWYLLSSWRAATGPDVVISSTRSEEDKSCDKLSFNECPGFGGLWVRKVRTPRLLGHYRGDLSATTYSVRSDGTQLQTGMNSGLETFCLT